MPIYDFKCGFCGHVDEEYRKMSSDSVQECPKCGVAAYTKQITLAHTDLKEFHKPIEMLSIAMEDIDEIRQMKAKCPDVDLSDDPADPNYGVPIARSRKAKLQALEAAGFIERS